MKTVFTSQAEVAHLWANELQREARYSGGNFYFYGNTIYSYGHHYPCGKIVRNKQGEKAYILNDQTRSNTTAKHMAYTYGAIPNTGKVFKVNGCVSPELYTNNKGHKWYRYYDNAVAFVAYHLNCIFEYFQKQHKARSRDYSGAAMYHIQEISGFIKFFDLDEAQIWLGNSYNKVRRPAIVDYFKSPKSTRKLKTIWDCDNERFSFLMEIFRMLDEKGWLTNAGYIPNMGDELRQMMVAFFESDTCKDIEARIKKLKEAERRAAAAERRKNIKLAEAALKRWRDGKIDYFDTYLYYEWEQEKKWNAALRIHNGHIETSKGINLSFEEGKRLWALIKAFESSKPFQHDLAMDLNGSKWKFNSYENHVLTAGCHMIPFSECQSIANQMGWN